MNNTGDFKIETSVSITIQDQSYALIIGGDLTNIEVIREFWQVAIEMLNNKPPALWVNFTAVTNSDTKLAACIVAILQRAKEEHVIVNFIGSKAVSETLSLCKFPALSQYTKAA
tara:strand:- start:95 stop:436 length:342 start_codon:yes stop_codon:yes gene_type:complete